MVVLQSIDFGTTCDKFEYQKTFDRSNLDLRSKFHLLGKIEEWCRINIGKGGWLLSDNDLWNVDSIFGHITFKFKQHSHYMLFVLKWG